MHCYSCDANSGAKRISPAATIFEGRYWLLEHAYPTSLGGWLVVVLRRHCENLHELSRSEWIELAEIQYLAIAAMKDLFVIDREYVCCFAEKEGFKHLHFHLIPKYTDCDQESIGIGAFRHLKVSQDEAIEPSRVIEICDSLREAIQTRNRVDQKMAR